MSEVVIAENINCNDEEQIYKYTIDMIDINTILFNIMNTDTGINYKLHIKKNSEWCQENLYKTQNDFSQLYKMLNDCVFNKDSMFKYELIEEKENINFKMEMKNNTQFFVLELEFKLERHISENGIVDDRLNSIEYQFNIYKDKTNETIQKLQDDNEKLKIDVCELIDFKLKIQEKNKKEYEWLNTKWSGMNHDSEIDSINWCNKSYDHGGASEMSDLRQHFGAGKTFLEVVETRYINKFMKRWFNFHMEGLIN